MKKCILFVGLDLEPFLNLPDQLTAPEDEWEIVLAASGKEAFRHLARHSFDAAVVDLALADIEGARVLEELKQNHQPTFRIAYAAASSEPHRMKQWGAEHHLLIKPCTPRILHELLKRAFTFSLWLPDKVLHGLVTNLQLIPSPPSFYNEVIRELNSPSGSLEAVGQIIARDPAMTAKVLQMANSAAFGLQQKVTDAGTAVMYLGVETVKSLILLAHTFSYFEGFKQTDFALQPLWNHLFATAQCARRIAQEEGFRASLQSKAFTAGLLHDLGKLVLAVNLPVPFGQAVRIARNHQVALWKIERDLLGASHGEIGAALLGIWGLPDDIVEAVAWHHEPTRGSNPELCPLTVVHAANVLAHETRKDSQGLPAPEFDLEYLNGFGLADRLPAWRAVCA